MKKYYGYFIYNDEQYVIRFKVSENLKWVSEKGYFSDFKGGACTFDYLANRAAYPLYKYGYMFSSCFKISHKDFIDALSNGVKRWKPNEEIIVWD